MLVSINNVLVAIGAALALFFGVKQLGKREQRQKQEAESNERAIEISTKARESRSEPLPSDVGKFLHERGRFRD